MASVTLEQQYQPIVDHNDGQLSTWEQAATHFVRGALCLPLRDRLAAADPVAWDTALDLLDSDDPTLYHCGVVGLLRVLATTPNSGSAVAQRLLAELVRCHTTAGLKR